MTITTQPDDAYDTDAKFLLSVLSSSGDCIKVLDLDANLIYMSKGGQVVMEISDFNQVRGCPWPDFWKGPGNQDALEAVATAKAGGVGRFRGAADTFKGNPRYWDVQVTPILGDDGKPERLLSVSRDITDLKTAEAVAELLNQELGHRIKNQLAVMQSIVNQSLRGASDIPAAKLLIGGRLDALSRAHSLLVGTTVQSTSMRDLVEAATNMHVGSVNQFVIAGPALDVGPKAALSLALILHELSTNAVKYGALSTPGGRVTVSWTSGTPGADDFELMWTESGGPLVAEPKREGFGTRLVRAGIGGDTGEVSIKFAPSGLVARFSGSLSNIASAR